ncbi:MAG: L,D-transpeptidase family protein [Candidatus Omnitrophica bacterium]|nr:L,D-transpeptidase family protein [Candidatus Omnitrophota bacterium]
MSGLTLVSLMGLGVFAKGTPPQSAPPAPPPPSRALLAKAEKAKAEGSYSEARGLYQQVLQENPSSEAAASAQERLGAVNMKLILSPSLTPDSPTHTVEKGDTLSKIAKRFHTTVEYLKAANALQSDVIRPGQRLKVLKASFSVIVDKSQNTLTLKNGEEVLKVYPCSTGQGGITPTGSFRVVNRLVDPPWYTPEGVIPPGDPRNILGTRWLGFDAPGYGIHGTTDPASIGKSVTQGCVRLANPEVEELFILLPEGTPVKIVE